MDLPAGSLRLADVGYFKVDVFKQLNDRGVWWLSRLPARVGIWQEDKVIHLAPWLAQQTVTRVDQPVELTAQRLSCRLLAVRVPQDVAEQRRKRVRQDARDRTHSHLKPETLALCDWTVLVTNLDAVHLTLDEALGLLRLRWQIELLFKLWKQHLSVDAWRSRLPLRILSEVYAKLLIALIQHWLLLIGCWDNERRSVVKACLVLRKHAFHLLAALYDCTALVLTLCRILPALAHCSVQKRKARPAAFQLLARASP